MTGGARVSARMNRAEEYLQRAKELRERAQQWPPGTERNELNRVADEWLKMAKRAGRKL